MKEERLERGVGARREIRKGWTREVGLKTVGERSRIGKRGTRWMKEAGLGREVGERSRIRNRSRVEETGVEWVIDVGLGG